MREKDTKRMEETEHGRDMRIRDDSCDDADLDARDRCVVGIHGFEDGP